MKTLNYNVIFKPEADGGFTATVPALPGCVTYGRNLKDAKTMVLDAIKIYIQSLKKHNEPIPSDNESFITSIGIETFTKQKISTYA